MSKSGYVSKPVPVAYKKLNGGLNSTSGPLGLQDNEASDIQNIDFDKFGSILKRNGSLRLNASTANTSSVLSDGLFWYEYDASGTTTRYAMNVGAGKIMKMDGLDGTWDDITGGITLATNNMCDFESFLNTVIVTNNNDAPVMWSGTSNASTMGLPTGLTKAKFVTQFQNYTLFANVTVSGVTNKSRFYWSTIKTIDTWNSADFIDVSKDDGQEITGFKVLGQTLVVYKEQSIYLVLFTGDRDIPFLVQKTNSDAGCVAPFSIQEVENGHVFLAYDGLYFFDGNTSFKMSDRINATFLGLNRTRFPNAVSTYQHDKNRYWLSLTSSGASTNDTIITWDSFNNAFSVYNGIDASALTKFLVSGLDERPYFADYAGFTYRGDIGTDDQPSGTTTAINAFYATNWKDMGDLVDVKSTPHMYVYHQLANATLTFIYAYDFDEGDTYSQTFSLATSTDVYGTAVYGTATYAGSGGSDKRRDLVGRGRTVRVKFSNNVLGETFQIDGLGVQAQLETNV